MNDDLKVGDRIKDNDPRMTNRVLTITGLGLVTANGVQSVRAKGFAPPEVTISTKRIYTDGKPRRSGFSLVKGADTMSSQTEREALTLRDLIAGAWLAGYYHAGYTHDSAYACVESEKFADAKAEAEFREAARAAQAAEAHLRAALADMTADRDSWQSQASDRVDDALRFAKERDVAIAQERERAQQWRKAVQEAYGWLWHVNNEPMAPVPMWLPEKAAYQARKALRELLNSSERGEAINAVSGLLQNIAALKGDSQGESK